MLINDHKVISDFVTDIQVNHVAIAKLYIMRKMTANI